MLKIESFKETHLEDAAKLVIDRYKKLCKYEPLLPIRYKEKFNILPLLEDMIRSGCPGVAAVRGGQLAGFMLAWLMQDFRGKRSTYSPEWANASAFDESDFIYGEMYQKIAAKWVAEKYSVHYLSIFANDLNAINKTHWLGFGMLSVDALRGLQPVKGSDHDVDILLATSDHLDHILELNQGLREYMMGTPSFFIPEVLNAQYYEDWLEEPNKEIWMAYIENEPVAFLRTGPANDDVCRIIYEEKTTSIYGAFTKGIMRGRDVATSLLNRMIRNAGERGYQRCAVDFESMNILGSRFWLRHSFNPVCYSFVRHIDERLFDQQQ